MELSSKTIFQWTHSRNEKLFKCDQCNITFCFQNDMVEHFLHNHELKVYYACSFCLKNFESSNTLLDHFESQHISLYYSCSKCKSEYNNIKKLFAHIMTKKNCKNLSSSSKTVAFEKRYLLCGLCPKEFSTPSLLRSHIASQHLGTFNCHKGHEINAENVCSIDHFVNFSCDSCEPSTKNIEKVEQSVSSTLREAINCISNTGNEDTSNDDIVKVETSSDNDGSEENTVFICGECNIKFENMKSLTKHLKVVHDVNVEITEDDASDNDTGNLCSSLASGSKNEFSSKYSCYFLCIFCLKKFRKKNFLENHEKIHLDDVDPDQKLRMVCDFCQDLLFGHKSYEKHIANCSKKSNFKPQLHRDPKLLNSHENISKLKKIKENIPLKRETKSKSSDEDDPTEEVFNWDESELTEVKDIDLSSTTKFSIKQDPLDFDKSDLDEKNSTCIKIKGESKIYVCHYCEKAFRSKHKFLDHYYNHDKTVKVYSCPACDAKLGYSTSISKHVQMHLRDLGMIKQAQKCHLCSGCGKGFRDRATLKRHEAMVHLKIGHLCLECDKKFSSRHALKQHSHQHTKELLYKCDQCYKQYGNSSSLINHKKKHSDQKFVCDVCSKSFSLKHHLLRHINTHVSSAAKSAKKIKKENIDYS